MEREMKKKPRLLKRGDFAFMASAIDRWLGLPEAQGFGKVTGAKISVPWAEGPRVDVELTDIGENGGYLHLLFYFSKKMLGYRVVAVWTMEPRERIWPT